MSDTPRETVADSPPPQAPAKGQARPSDEMLPFLNNFHDIFTTIGVLILLGGMGVAIVQIMAGLGIEEGGLRWQMALMGLVGGFAVATWLLSALLVGHQRRILPGIVLCGAFTAAATTVLVWAYAQFLQHGIGVPEDPLAGVVEPDSDTITRDAVNSVLAQLPIWFRTLPIVLGLAALVPVAMFYFSFRLPFAGGLLGVGLVKLAIAVLLVLDPFTVVTHIPSVILASGLVLLFAGIVFDARDPERTTRLSGTAFWLHLFAAPVIMLGTVVFLQFGASISENEIANQETQNLFAAVAENSPEAPRLAAVTLLVIGVFALISLLINRRALIVSGLVTTGVAFWAIVNTLGFGEGVVVALTLLMLGGAVVLLGAAWNPVRRVLLAPVPSRGPLARIFPPAGAVEG